MIKFTVKNRNSSDTRIVTLNNTPDTCPLCDSGISATPLFGIFDDSRWSSEYGLQLFFLCPKDKCGKTFVAYYRAGTQYGTDCNHIRSAPISIKENSFNQIIKNISPSFIKIYNQSFGAEQSNLLEICGVGYRKALEFLIKDYLIKNNSEASKIEDIKKKFLGKCIDEFVDNQNIKAVAKRAVWLGNDETHYTRLWEGKDLSDLKKLIDLTISWIEVEEKTREIMNEMPEGK